MPWTTDFYSANFHSLKNGLFRVSCSRYNNDAKLFIGSLGIQEETLELSCNDEERVQLLIEWADAYIKLIHLEDRTHTLDDLKNVIKQLLPNAMVNVDSNGQVLVNTGLQLADKGVLKKV